MPHLTIEYSANLEARVDMTALCERLHQAILETDLFELGAIRVRALKAEHFAVADHVEGNSFLDMSFRIGTGRDAADKARVGQSIFTAAERQLHTLFETPHFALSLEIREIDPDLSWKRNAIHPRLRGA